MNFPNSVRSAIFKKIDPRIHFEKVKTTPDKAADYCMKEETRLQGPWEFGVRPVSRNSKHDWEQVFKYAKLG